MVQGLGTHRSMQGGSGLIFDWGTEVPHAEEQVSPRTKARVCRPRERGRASQRRACGLRLSPDGAKEISGIDKAKPPVEQEMATHSSLPACRIPRDILNPIKVKSAFLKHGSRSEVSV